MQSSFRTPDPIVPPRILGVATASATPRWQWAVAIAGALALLAAVIGGWVLAHRPSAAPPPVVEQRVGSRQVPLREEPDGPWLTFTRTWKVLLGEPLWEAQPYRGRPACVGYEHYVICVQSDPRVQHSVRAFEPLPLGRESLARVRAVPEPGVAAAPIVERYFAALAEDLRLQGETELVGVTDVVQHWFGRPLRRPECVSGPDGGGGQCLQVFDRQVLVWPMGADDPRAVRLWPLGLEAPRP